jgi:hypothetical protein
MFNRSVYDVISEEYVANYVTVWYNSNPIESWFVVIC